MTISDQDVQWDVYSNGLAFTMRATHLPTGLSVESGAEPNFRRSQVVQELFTQLQVMVNENAHHDEEPARD